MRKLIAAINMTLDGYCDHTDMIADEELHQHFTDALHNAGVLLYGRITYELMESYWPLLVKEPSGNKADDDFARAIDGVPKILYSRTRQHVDWKGTTLLHELRKEDIESLKAQPGKDIYAGSPSIIVALTNMGLIDEYHLVVHPVVKGKGLPLFKNISASKTLSLFDTKTFGSGAVVMYYKSIK